MILTPEEAFRDGTNIRTALRIEPQQTRAALLKLVTDLVKFVDAKRTLESIDDYLFTVECIIESHPTMTLEEVKLVTQGIKKGQYGKMYERLKTQEILDACRKLESDRAEILERIHRGPITRGLREGQHITPKEPETLLDVMKKRNPLFKGKK